MKLRSLLRWLPALLWMGLIFYVSSRSQLPTGGGMLGKLESYGGHLVEYAVLGGLLQWGADRKRIWAWGLALALLYAASDELHQQFVPGRDASPLDLLADSVGAAVGSVLAVRLNGIGRRLRGEASPNRS